MERGIDKMAEIKIDQTKEKGSQLTVEHEGRTFHPKSLREAQRLVWNLDELKKLRERQK